MATGKDTQLESVIDEVLKNGNIQSLHEYLEGDKPESAPIHCSQQFLTKLDRFIKKSLTQRDGTSANLGFAVLYKYGRNMKLPHGCKGLPGLISQGLPKMWFDKCKRLWSACGPCWDDTLLRLSECFFDALMVVHESCKEGTDQITKLFFYAIAHLVVEPGIYILIRKEAVRKFNFILGKMPVNLKKNMKMETSQKVAEIQVKMARHILDCGDYDFQTAMIEAFCRINTPDQRKQFANRWFGTGPVSKAFIKIKNSEFETDCRKFLNFVNETHSGRKRVYSYPCLKAYLDRFELLKPLDENLKELWVDFNLGSHSISFYFSLAGENMSKWETICIAENEVQCYTVKEECRRHVLQLNLSEVVIVGEVEGSSLKLCFSCALNIQQAVSSVFGERKNTNFVGKTSTVKTTVQILSEERSSQVVPESQLSVGHSGNHMFPGQSLSVQMSTPAKISVAESVVVIKNNSGSDLSAAKGHGRPALKMVPSCNERDERRRGAKVSVANSTVAGAPAEKNKPQKSRLSEVSASPRREESPGSLVELDFVPGTRTWKNSCHKISVSEMLMMPTQKICSHPKADPPRSSLSPQQHQSLSKSVSAVCSSKKIHCELTQRRQLALDGQQQGPVQEESFSLQNKSNIKLKAKVTSARKSRSQASKEEEGCLISGAKAPASKALKVLKNPPEVMARANPELSNKEKGDAELAGNLVKLISRRYENAGKDTAAPAWNQSFVTRPVFNLGLTSTTKNNVSGPQSCSKPQDSAKTSVTNPRQNPVSVNTSFGKSIKTTTNTTLLSSGIHDTPVLLNSSKNGQAVHKENRHLNRHLFSDTDSIVTDISWLREKQKDKSKVVKYSRRTAVKPNAVSHHTPYASDSDTLSKKPVTPSAKPKKSPCAKQATEPDRPQAAGRRPRRAAANTTKSYKERDSDDSLSELETHMMVEKMPELKQGKKNSSPIKQPTKSSAAKLESSKTESKQQHSSKEANRKLCAVVPAVKTIKSTTSVQSANTCRKLDSSHEAHLKKTSKVKITNQGNTVPEHSRSNHGKFPLAKEQTSMLRDAWARSQTSLCLASPNMEKMRSAERSAPALALSCSALLTPGGAPLSASPKLTRQDVPSPIRPLPSPRAALSCNESFKPRSFLAAGKKRSLSKIRKASSLPSGSSLTSRGQIPVRADRAEMFPVHQPQPSPPQSTRHFIPLLTSTLAPQLLAPHSLLAERPTNCSSNLFDSSSTSSASRASLSLSSIHPSVFRSQARDVSALTRVNQNSLASDAANQVSETLLSGPSRKRHISTSSDSENEKKKQKRSKLRGQRSSVMKPRRLSKAYTGVCADTKVTQVSSQHTSSGQWEAELDGDEDVSEFLETSQITAMGSSMCQQFSSGMKMKFENRNKVMAVYNEQSLETMQQHISTLNTELTKYRTQRVEKVLEVLQHEIHKLEQNDAVLEDMEKDLNAYWKKQSVTFHTYLEQDSKRHSSLSKALQDSVSHNLEYEESLFTSQMCAIRKDMKSAQDRLLAQMQEEEIQSVKRGLHAMFFP